MSLTRKMLKAMGIEEEKIEQIIEAHTEATEALKSDRDSYKSRVEDFDKVKKELDELKKDDYKKKYDDEHKAFEDFKNQKASESVKAAKLEGLKAIYKNAGIPESKIGTVIKLANLEEIELDESGKVKDAEKKIESAKQEWKDIIPTVKVQGAGTATPPEGGKNAVTAEQFSKMSYRERLKLYDENTELYNELSKRD